MTANTKQLGYNDAGTHDVTLTASDGKKTSTATISVVVKDKNRPPSFAIGSFD
jgi:PKD repeat protein